MVDPGILDEIKKTAYYYYIFWLNFKLISKFLQRRGRERRGVPTPDYPPDPPRNIGVDFFALNSNFLIKNS